MSKFTINLKTNGRCCIQHHYAEATIITDLPPEYGGNGRSFSSTDLVSAAVGTCVMTTIDKILEREGYDPKLTEIEVTKELCHSPKMIKSIQLKISHPRNFNVGLIRKLEKASQACPVKRSISDDVAINIEFITR